MLIADADKQHVGVVSHDISADFTQLRCHPRRIVVIVFQARHVIFQRVQSGSRQNTRLTHPAAGHFAPPVGASDVVCAANQQGTYRRAQPFRRSEYRRL